jgi:hypothetical protein
MGNYQVELYKGEDPLSNELTRDDNLNIDQAVYGVQLAFDKGEADKAAIFVERDGELLSIITKSKGEFDVKEVAVEINQLINGE